MVVLQLFLINFLYKDGNIMARVLAIGGAGFIGSHIVRLLLGQGHEVTVVDNFSRYGYIAYDFYTHPRFKLINKDIRDVSPDVFSGFDHILCLAAHVGGVRYLNMNPYSILRDNTDILMHAIDSTISSSPSAVFYFFSSSMVYERTINVEENREEQRMPSTSYGMQKLYGEHLVKYASSQQGLNYIIIRPFNAVGAGEIVEQSIEGRVIYGMSHVIPDFVHRALIKQSPFEILGDGSQVRIFTHVDDIAAAVAIMIEKGIKNDDFDICGRERLTMRELAKRVWTRVYKDIPFPGLKHLTKPNGDVSYMYGSYAKARDRLGWEPAHGIDDMIDDTIGFIKGHLMI